MQTRRTLAAFVIDSDPRREFLGKVNFTAVRTRSQPIQHPAPRIGCFECFCTQIYPLSYPDNGSLPYASVSETVSGRTNTRHVHIEYDAVSSTANRKAREIACFFYRRLQPDDEITRGFRHQVGAWIGEKHPGARRAFAHAEPFHCARTQPRVENVETRIRPDRNYVESSCKLDVHRQRRTPQNPRRQRQFM